MSRRLGEDPLTRARKKRGTATKTALTSTSVTVDETSAAEAATAPSRSSFNDVFFQRKSPEAEGPTTVKTGSLSGQAYDDDAHQPSPEISEISEIPEIRELATAPAATSTAVDASPSLAMTEVAGPSTTMADSTHRTEERQDAAGVHGVDEITTAPEAEHVPAQMVQLETRTDATRETVVAPSEAKPEEASAIVSAVTPPSDEPEKVQPAPQKGGFFKKLFGRFGSK